jgi:hypothetical protein
MWHQHLLTVVLSATVGFCNNIHELQLSCPASFFCSAPTLFLSLTFASLPGYHVITLPWVVQAVHGRSSYQAKIPNGNAVVDSQNELWCVLLRTAAKKSIPRLSLSPVHSTTAASAILCVFVRCALCVCMVYVRHGLPPPLITPLPHTDITTHLYLLLTSFPFLAAVVAGRVLVISDKLAVAHATSLGSTLRQQASYGPRPAPTSLALRVQGWEEGSTIQC